MSSWASRLPSAPGVYRFRDATGRVLYIGRAKQLRRRVGSYWLGLRGREHLAAMVARIARVEAVVCDSDHEAAWLERNLLEYRLPRWNRTPGAEVPVYIRLDARGLTVVHSPSHFGPYLGGEKVRLAVAALHRVLPLRYAGANLSGSEREMAGKHGVGPGDRDALVTALTEVLHREPFAVAAIARQLRERRDRASEALAFELAARVQLEIEALDWVTSPQRVTHAEPHELTAAGWAGGVLVRFDVRNGRLCTWSQRACTHANARRHLADTPPAWADFATRNAELAARLQAGPNLTVNE